MVVVSQISELECPHVDLVSPTSNMDEIEYFINNTDLSRFSKNLNNQLIDDYKIQEQPLQLESFISVTSLDGCIRSANFPLSIISNTNNLFDFFSAENDISTIYEKLNEKSSENEAAKCTKTLLVGFVCFAQFRNSKLPVILKLQLFPLESGERFLLWQMKKASLVQWTGDIFTHQPFSVRGSRNLYIFKKANILITISETLKIVDGPIELLEKLTGTELFYGIDVHQIFEMPSEFFEAIQNQKTKKDVKEDFSASSLDLSTEGKDFSYLKSKELYSKPLEFKALNSQFRIPITVTLYKPYSAENGDCIYPLRIKYDQARNETHSETLPNLKGFQILKKISDSLCSDVYEVESDLNEKLILKRSKVNHENSNEVGFYKHYKSLEKRCKYIDVPLRIDEGEFHDIYLNASIKYIDLYEYIDSRPLLSDSEIQTIFRQILDSISFLHAQRIVHRDIKDENILICLKSKEIRLIDFGSSAFLAENNANCFTEYAGTYAYAPPEVLKGQAYSGTCQDIWCLGIVLYTLCFKEAPFRTPKETLQGYLRLPVNRPTSVVGLLRKLLDPCPERRPKATEIYKDLFLQENFD